MRVCPVCKQEACDCTEEEKEVREIQNPAIHRGVEWGQETAVMLEGEDEEEPPPRHRGKAKKGRK